MRWVVVVVVLAGCYGQGYRDCQVSCAGGTGCPSGLMCEQASQQCRLPGASGACSAGDAGGGPGEGGADSSIDVSVACWSGVTPSNFAPCDPGFPQATPMFGPGTLDTDAGTLDGNTAPGGPYPAASPVVWLIHLTSFDLASSAVLHVVGSRPLLIVSDTTITIDGTIDATGASTRADDCTPTDAPSSQVAGAGGGGGGFGTVGGDGGLGSDTAAQFGHGGAPVGTAFLTPLHPGCPGGMGGAPVGLLPSPGGAGGGAIELAAEDSIAVSGGIQSGGDGGKPGPHGMTGCGGAACAGGGGGGGAGGAIFLEALTIHLSASSQVCATGGGGGEGGQSSTTIDSAAGMPGSCAPGIGGSTSGVDDGGDGGPGSADNGQSGGIGRGGTGITGVGGGGGGGGGAGRIRIHANVTTFSGTIAPPAALM